MNEIYAMAQELADHYEENKADAPERAPIPKEMIEKAQKAAAPPPQGSRPSSKSGFGQNMQGPGHATMGGGWGPEPHMPGLH